jgi:hypothetical protein
MEATYTVRADTFKNRLYIIFDGFFSDALMQKACDLIDAESDRLQPGFSVITDISRCKPATQAGAQIIQKTQEYLAAHGVGRVIRVTSHENTIIKLQFQRREHGSYKAEYADSVEAADKILDGKG